MPIANVTDMQWEDVPIEDVNATMRRQVITGDLLTVAKIYFKDGSHVPMHSHHNEQITQVISGEMHFRFGEEGDDERVLRAGDVVVIPAHVPHEARCVGDVVEMDMWAPRRDDWLDGTDDYLRDA